MNKDELIRMAREAGLADGPDNIGDDVWISDGLYIKVLERFAALVEKQVMEVSMPAMKAAMKAERENGAREERERCEELWESLRISDRQIQETIEASITAERERCAKLVEDMDMRHSWKYADMLRRGVSE